MKIPEPVKVGKDRFRIRLRLDGVNKYVYGSTKAECKHEAALIKSEYKTGKRTMKKADTPALKNAIDAYIDERKKTISPSTITGYKRIRDGRFKKYMDTPIGELRDQWQKIIDEESALCSPKTLKNAFYFVKSVYKRNDLSIPSNVTLPGPINNSKGWLDYEQITTLVESVKGTKWELLVLFGLHSLRRSEIMALDWKNIDLKREEFHVKGAVVKDYDGNYVFKESNKNESSQRTIPFLIPELKTALNAVPEDERKGRVININGNSILYEVNKACRAAGVPEVGTHGLRHSFASLAEHMGLPKKVTMYLGGWSDDHTMDKIYTHVAPKDQLIGVDKIRGFFGYYDTPKNAQ